MRFTTVKMLLLGGVLITFDQLVVASCPTTPRQVVKNEDGTYRDAAFAMTPAILCVRREQWQEEWTDAPEKDGVFIRRVGE